MQQDTRVLYLVQKWSIVAAIFVIAHQTLAVLTYIDVWEETNYHGVTNADYVLQVMGILLAVGRVVTSILILIPSCMKDPQAAHRWRLIAFPYMIVNFQYIVYTVVLHVYNNFRFYGGSKFYEIIYVSEETALSLALVVCAFLLQRRLQLQMPPASVAHSHEGGCQQYQRPRLHLVQKWSVAVAAFVSVHGILFIIYVNEVSLGKSFRITGSILGVGKLISSLLILIPSCKDSHREALLAYPFMIVHVAYIAYIFARDVYYQFRHFGEYDMQEVFIYMSLRYFLTEIALSVVFFLCGFFLRRRLHRQRDISSQENLPLQLSDS